MIVPGVVLDENWWAFYRPATPTVASSSTTTSTFRPSRENIGSKPAHGGTLMGTSLPLQTEPEATHFVQLGGPAILVGTLVFSNPTVQKWIWDILPGEAPWEGESQVY